MSAVSEEMTSTTENVSITIQEVAKGAGTQAQSLSDMTMAMNDFSKELEGYGTCYTGYRCKCT